MSGNGDGRSRRSRRRLDARGSQEIVYCHECDNEWFRGDHGLTCPRCDGQTTEIIDPRTDPRPRSQSTPRSGRNPLHDHNPWSTVQDSDPDEMDIDEQVHPSRSQRRSSRSRRQEDTPRRRSSTARSHHGREPQEDTMRSFQDLVGSLLGPNFRAAESGRSDQNTLFSGPGWTGRTFQIGGQNGNPRVSGGTWTFSASIGGGPSRTQTMPGQTGGPPDPISLLNEMLGTMSPRTTRAGANIHGFLPGFDDAAHGHMPGLFSSMFHGPHMMQGDAVYSQEAMDRIMSQLMEQQPTSNAPGPAPRSDIERLPKRKLDEQLLGPEGKGECSVCMDDVKIGDEVVQLPCTHWFHEQCASAWLSEHNTCPICRKGISGPPVAETDKKPSPASSTLAARQSATSDARDRSSRHRSSNRGGSDAERRQSDRLAAIRQAGRITPPSPRRGSLRNAAENQAEEPSPHGSSHRSHGRTADMDEESSPRMHGFRTPSISGSFSEGRRQDIDPNASPRHARHRQHQRDEEHRSSDKGKERERPAERYRMREDSDRERHRSARSDYGQGSTVDASETGRRNSRTGMQQHRRESRRESSGLPSWLRDTFGGSSSSSRKGD